MSFEWYVDGQLIDSTQNFTYTFENDTLIDVEYIVELALYHNMAAWIVQALQSLFTPTQ